MPSCCRHARSTIIFFHDRLVLKLGDLFRLNPGGNVKVAAQAGVLLQPVFVVALYPVNFSIFESEKAHRTDHLIIVFHVTDAVVLCQRGFQPGRQRIKGCVTDAQHIDTVGMEAVTEIPVVFGEIRRNEHKIHTKSPSLSGRAVPAVEPALCSSKALNTLYPLHRRGARFFSSFFVIFPFPSRVLFRFPGTVPELFVAGLCKKNTLW